MDAGSAQVFPPFLTAELPKISCFCSQFWSCSHPGNIAVSCPILLPQNLAWKICFYRSVCVILVLQPSWEHCCQLPNLATSEPCLKNLFLQVSFWFILVLQPSWEHCCQMTNLATYEHCLKNHPPSLQEPLLNQKPQYQSTRGGDKFQWLYETWPVQYLKVP